MKTCLAFAAAAAAMTVAAAPAHAQSSPDPRNPIGAILGAIFGDRQAAPTSLDAQWAAGQTPLTNQHAQFHGHVDAQVRARAVDQATGVRLKADYDALVQLETRYGADRRFTLQERSDLANRYGALTQVLAAGGYADAATWTQVADGRAAFERRVDSAVAARRINRTEGRRLKSDYAVVAQIEAGYLRDGTISAAERADLDARLDALDVRVGDTAYAAAALTPRARLDAIARALPGSGLASAAQAQLLVEHEDLSRLEAAYARFNASAEERSYLERRLAELEVRARLRR
jgi:hypothetical protein